MKRLPALSNATAWGLLRLVLVAWPPSPLKPELPLPATVAMVPPDAAASEQAGRRQVKVRMISTRLAVFDGVFVAWGRIRFQLVPKDWSARVTTIQLSLFRQRVGFRRRRGRCLAQFRHLLFPSLGLFRF